MNRNTLLRSAFTAILVLSVTYMFAPPATPGGSGTPSCWPPPCVPIDGGISLLLAAGAVLGLKKGFDSYKDSKKVGA